MCYMKQKILISIILLIAVFISCTFVFDGSIYFKNYQTYYDYSISVQGLSNYNYNPKLNDSPKDSWFDFSVQALNVTTVIVPIPMKNREQIFTDEEMQNRSFGVWTSRLVGTEQGKMLAFQTKNKNLTDINARFRKNFDYNIIKYLIKNVLSYPVLLYPVSSIAATNNTLRSHNKNVRNYTTYVYIDQNVQPVKSNNNTITFNLEFTVKNKDVHNRTLNTYRINIFKVIREGSKGPIPVKARLTNY